MYFVTSCLAGNEVGTTLFCLPGWLGARVLCRLRHPYFVFGDTNRWVLRSKGDRERVCPGVSLTHSFIPLRALDGTKGFHKRTPPLSVAVRPSGDGFQCQAAFFYFPLHCPRSPCFLGAPAYAFHLMSSVVLSWVARASEGIRQTCPNHFHLHLLIVVTKGVGFVW